MRTQYYVASSIDGFIAEPEETLDWLLSRDTGDAEGAPGCDDFIAGTGALAMGSRTYEWVLAHEDGRWPYDLPCWVFTSRELEPRPGVTFTSDDVTTVHRSMVEAAGGRNVWLVGGGELVGRFADAGLLDEILLALVPVTLGAGYPLLPRRVELRLEESFRAGELLMTRFSVAR
ncbi:MAG: dihydrofolate reductase [Frankiales bacterium]|nr:MAG: dihydrofolate reductase [Frankiales bacterium]